MIKAADAMKKKQSKKYTHSLEQQQQQKIYKIERNEMKDQRKKEPKKKCRTTRIPNKFGVIWVYTDTHTHTLFVQTISKFSRIIKKMETQK